MEGEWFHYSMEGTELDFREYYDVHSTNRKVQDVEPEYSPYERSRQEDCRI